MKFIRLILTAACAAAVFACTGCTSSLEIHALKDGGALVSFSAGLGSAFRSVVTSLSGENADSALFNAGDMASQFRAAGMDEVKVTVPTDSSVAVSTKLRAGASDPVSKAGLVSFTKNNSSSSMVLTLSPANLSALYASLPETVRSYIDLFMAPVFTGESMTKSEYLDLVASVYGQNLADEIAVSYVSIVLSAPDTSGKKKKVSVPLADLLAASEPQTYAVSW